MSIQQNPAMDNTCNKEYQEFLTNIQAAKLDEEGIKTESNMDSASFFPTSETVKAVNYSRLMEKGLELPIHKVAGDIISTNQRAFQGHRPNLVTISQFKEPGLAQAFIGVNAELMHPGKSNENRK